MESIKDLPLMERPRERLLHYGPAVLSNSELIAILLGSGTNRIPLMLICEQLMSAIDDQPVKLATMSTEQLCKIRGIGEVKAITLAAAIELGKRVQNPSAQPVPLKTMDQVAAFLSPYLPGQESAGYFLVMCNDQQELLATQEFAILEKEPPAVKFILQSALKAGAAEIILCRSPFNLSEAYLNKEKAYIIQLDAAASMVNLGWRGILIIGDI